MATLYFKVSSDWQEVVRLRQECEKLESQLKKMDSRTAPAATKTLETQLASTRQQMMGMVTEAAKAGAAMERAFKQNYESLLQKMEQVNAKIAESTQRINQSAEKIAKAQERLESSAGTQPKGGNASGSGTSANQAETASVQAQAKAYEELAGEIDAVMGTRSQNIRRMMEEQNAIRLINAEIRQLTKYQGENSTLTDNQKRRLEQLNSSLLQHKAALAELRQSVNNSIKLDNAAATSMNALSQSLGRMRMAYRELTEEERSSPFGQELLASINQADSKIKQLDATIGNHQRNVGNYASGWNGLNMSVQQIVRELPSATMGLSMFFLAISNNLPILTDEIKRAREANEALKKSGQSTTPVWKQLVSSLFSWQTALMAGITLMTVYGKEISEWVSGLFNAKKQIDLGAESAKALNEAMLEGGKSAQQEVATLNLLYRATQNTAKGMGERLAAAEKLQSQYPAYFGNMSKENILAGKAADSYARLAQSITASVRAQAARDSIVKQQNTVLENEQKINDAYARLSKAEESLKREQELLDGLSGNAEASEFQAAVVSRAQDRVDEIEEEIAGYRAAIYQANKISADLERGIDIEDLLFGTEGTEEPTANAANALKSYLDELAQLRQDNEDRQVELMQEGTDRQLAEIDLRYRRIRDKVRELESSLTAQQGGRLTPEQQGTFLAAYNGIDRQEQAERDSLAQRQLQADEQAMNEYLSRYGTFIQRRQALEKQYQQRITEAGGADTWHGKALQKQLEEALGNLNMEELKESINWELVFGDLENASKDSLGKVKKQLETFKESKEYKGMTIDQKKVIDEALNDIQSAVIDKGGILGDLPAQLEALRKAQDELAKAQDEYNKALEDGTDAEKESARRKLNDAQKKVANQENTVEKSSKKAIDNIGLLSDSITQLGTASEMSLTQLGDLVSGLVSAFSESGGKISGIVGSVLSLLDSIGSQGLDGFVGNIFNSMFHAAYGAWDTVFGWTGIDFGGESDPRLAEDIERLTAANQDLERAVDNLSDKMDEAAVADASGIYEQQKAYIEQAMRNTQQMMSRSGAAHSDGFMGMGGEHSSNKRIDEAMSRADWQRISEIAGRTVDSASDFWGLTSEQMSNVADQAADLYGKIKDLGDNGHENASLYMDEYIQYYKQLEELQDQANEKLTSVSFDTVKSDFRNALLEMEGDTEAFAENFERAMQNAVLESMMTSAYDAQLKKWYDSFAASMDSNGLDVGEQELLRQQWDDIVNAASGQWQLFKELFGWDGDSSATGQQQATSRGFETITQDQAGELSGRFTAVAESNYRIEASITGLKAPIDQLAAQAGASRAIADDVRTILAQSYIELQGIRENTGAIVKPIRQMQQDIAAVRQNTARI